MATDLLRYCRLGMGDAHGPSRFASTMDDDSTPIEDAFVDWPEETTPQRTVAQLIFPAQDSYSEVRRAFFDEALTFHSVLAHKPLGSVMRARLAVYPIIASERFARSGKRHLEPTVGTVPV